MAVSTTKQRDLALLVALRGATGGGATLARATGQLLEALWTPGSRPTAAEEYYLSILRNAIAGNPADSADDEGVEDDTTP